MPAEPHQRRRYVSPRRQEQALGTRRAVLDAARELFIERGYVATTVGAIADRATVSPETVYATFKHKGYDATVPRPQSKLSAAERTALGRWVAQLEHADRHRKEVRAGFAAWVRRVGPAAVAHEMGITRGAINERLKSYEGTYRRRGTKPQP